MASPALAVGIVVVIWTQVRAGNIPPVDRWARARATEMRDPAFLALAEAVKHLGSWTWVAPVVLTIAFSVGLVQRTWRPVAVAASSLTGVAATAWLLKIVVARAGPHGVGPPAVDGSWPSGHALTAVVATLVLVGMLQSSGARRTLAVGLATLSTIVVGLALVYAGHHWLTDVLVAAPLGYLVVRVASAAADFLTADPRRGTVHIGHHEAAAP